MGRLVSTLRGTRIQDRCPFIGPGIPGHDPHHPEPRKTLPLAHLPIEIPRDGIDDTQEVCPRSRRGVSPPLPPEVGAEILRPTCDGKLVDLSGLIDLLGAEMGGRGWVRRSSNDEYLLPGRRPIHIVGTRFNEDVLRLQIPVDHAISVRVPDRITDPGQKLESLPNIEIVFSCILIEGEPINELHRQIRLGSKRPGYSLDLLMSVLHEIH